MSLGLSSLSGKLREHVLGSVDVGAEREVVNFSLISLVEVLSNDQVEDLLLRRVNAQILEDSLELLARHVA